MNLFPNSLSLSRSPISPITSHLYATAPRRSHSLATSSAGRCSGNNPGCSSLVYQPFSINSFSVCTQYSAFPFAGDLRSRSPIRRWTKESVLGVEGLRSTYSVSIELGNSEGGVLPARRELNLAKSWLSPIGPHHRSSPPPSATHPYIPPVS